MRKVFVILLAVGILVGCIDMETQTPSLPTATEIPFTATPEPDPVTPTLTSTTEMPTATAASDDFFTQMQISLPEPICTGLTKKQTEGPYYESDIPERNSLLEEGMQGDRLVLVGYVLDQNCQPLPNAMLDFWQADASGEYDNVGNRLRGRQFTDMQGRYYLETILPGIYPSRPIGHIHVKVLPAGGNDITTQLYFQEQSIDGLLRPSDELTIRLEDRDDYLLGYFNFVLQP
jgi:protocatechuate 3,4-dioxygenase beta subunit